MIRYHFDVEKTIFFEKAFGLTNLALQSLNCNFPTIEPLYQIERGEDLPCWMFVF